MESFYEAISRAIVQTPDGPAPRHAQTDPPCLLLQLVKVRRDEVGVHGPVHTGVPHTVSICEFKYRVTVSLSPWQRL